MTVTNIPLGVFLGFCPTYGITEFTWRIGLADQIDISVNSRHARREYFISVGVEDLVSLVRKYGQGYENHPKYSLRTHRSPLPVQRH